MGVEMATTKDLEIPLFMVPVEAGFPSPAADYLEGKLYLNEYLIKHPAATLFVKAPDDSMIKAGIFPGDILIVDKSLNPADKKVVIAVIDGGFSVRRIRKIKDKVFLVPENERDKSIQVEPEMDYEILGVVTNVIHPL
jgi:DNA polymerase V